jgi:peptidylprolyl isomerase domain and WD repeat-containing protein 1
MLEYWSGAMNDYEFPKNVQYDSKMDTDLYEYVKVKAVVLGIAFSKDGKLMAVMSDDRKIRLFNFLTGKFVKTIDESLDVYSQIQQVKLLVDLSTSNHVFFLNINIFFQLRIHLNFLIWNLVDVLQ